MCWHLSNGDVAMSLSRITGSSHENSLMSLNRFGAPPVLGIGGTLNMRAFRDIAARSPVASNLGICMELSRLSGKGFESVFTELNRPGLSR
jgi:hypothetical protein